MKTPIYKSRKERVSTLNEGHLFSNNLNFPNDYLIKTFYRTVNPTYYEEKILNEYILIDQNFGKEKDINFNSKLVSLLIDFARFYYARH